MQKVGVKIPPGVGQLKIHAVNKNFWIKNMTKNPSYNTHLSWSVKYNYKFESS